MGPMNYNSIILKTSDNKEIHFVTRGKAKKPTLDEALEYAKSAGLNIRDRDDEKDWGPPNPKIFLSDLRSGIEFCSNKYGVSDDTIENYIKQKAPHINLRQWNPGGPGSSGRG